MNCIHRIGASCSDRCNGRGDIEDVACLGESCPGYEEWDGQYDVAGCYALCEVFAENMLASAQPAQELAEHWLCKNLDITAADIGAARQRRIENEYAFA